MKIHRDMIILCALSLACLPARAEMQRMETLPETMHELRDPLLPTDYVAPDAEADEEEIDEQEEQRQAIEAQITWPRLRLRGITHAGGERYFAIIDQIGIVEAGDTVDLRIDDLIYTWQIDSITEEGLTTTRLHVTSVENPDQPVRIMQISNRKTE